MNINLPHTNKTQEIFMRIREYIRKNPKTNWGKNQLIQELDKMEEHMKQEKEQEAP